MSTEDVSKTFDLAFTDALCFRVLERVKGIEPSYSAWKAAALPLSYTRVGCDLTRRAAGLNRWQFSFRRVFFTRTGAHFA
jgi:hypothetical protein